MPTQITPPPQILGSGDPAYVSALNWHPGCTRTCSVATVTGGIPGASCHDSCPGQQQRSGSWFVMLELGFPLGKENVGPMTEKKIDAFLVVEVWHPACTHPGCTHPGCNSHHDRLTTTLPWCNLAGSWDSCASQDNECFWCGGISSLVLHG